MATLTRRSGFSFARTALFATVVVPAAGIHDQGFDEVDRLGPAGKSGQLSCPSDDTGTYVCLRDVLPHFGPNVRGDVYQGEAVLGGVAAMDALGMYHSGILIRLKDANGGVKNITIQWYAIHGLSSAVMPTVDPDVGLKFANDAWVVYTPDIDDTYWIHQTLIAKNVDEAQLNALFDFSADYRNDHPTYQLFSVQQFRDKEAGQILVNDQICDTFTKDSIFALKRAGAVMAKPTIRYNVMRMFAATAERVEFTQGVAISMAMYYGRLQQIMVEAQASASPNATVTERSAHLQHSLEIGFQTFAGGEPVFVGDPAFGVHQAVLTAPFFTVGSVWINTETGEEQS